MTGLQIEDTTRISNLIDQLVRCKAKDVENSQLINKLKIENFRLSKIVEALQNNLSSLKGISSKQSRFDEEHESKISKLTSLKTGMESKNKFIDERVNQMSRELRNLRIALEQSNSQKKIIECKYASVKSKLKKALNIIKRFNILKEYLSLHEKLHGRSDEDIFKKESNFKEKTRVECTGDKREVMNDRVQQLEAQWISDLFFSNHPSTSADETIFVIHTESGF